MAKRTAKKAVETETYPEFLRRVGNDYAEMGSEATAHDYRTAADRIEFLEAEVAALKREPKPGNNDVRYKLMVRRNSGVWEKVGNATMMGDGTIHAGFESMPVDGRLILDPLNGNGGR